MFRTFMIGAVSAAALMLSTGAFAQQSKSGTAEEAKAMLTKAVAAVKADRDLCRGSTIGQTAITDPVGLANAGDGGE